MPSICTSYHMNVYLTIEQQLAKGKVQQRWVQHVRRGVGADTPTNNKLYPILNSIGIENFMFELIEECDPTQLNEREKYYQEVFHAQDYGYSIK